VKKTAAEPDTTRKSQPQSKREPVDLAGVFARMGPENFRLSGAALKVRMLQLMWPYKHKKDRLTTEAIVAVTGLSRATVVRARAEVRRLTREHVGGSPVSTGRLTSEHVARAPEAHPRASEPAQAVESTARSAPVEGAPDLGTREIQKRESARRGRAPLALSPSGPETRGREADEVLRGLAHLRPGVRADARSLAAAHRAGRLRTRGQLDFLHGLLAQVRSASAEAADDGETLAERQARQEAFRRRLEARGLMR